MRSLLLFLCLSLSPSASFGAVFIIELALSDLSFPSESVQAAGVVEVDPTPTIRPGVTVFSMTSLSLSLDGGADHTWDEVDLLGSDFRILDFMDDIALELRLPLPDGLFENSLPYHFGEWRYWASARGIPELGDIDVSDIELILNTNVRLIGGGSGIGPDGFNSSPEDLIGSGEVTNLKSIPESSQAVLLLLGISWLASARSRSPWFNHVQQFGGTST